MIDKIIQALKITSLAFVNFLFFNNYNSQYKRFNYSSKIFWTVYNDSSTCPGMLQFQE